LIRYDSKSLEVIISSGCAQFTTPNPLNSRGWAVHRKSFNELRLWGQTYKVAAGAKVFRSATVPLWIPFLPVAIAAIVLWRRKHPPGAAKCPNCGYNLTGNVTGVCPECGEKTAGEGIHHRDR
jgi:hypothetical protein